VEGAAREAGEKSRGIISAARQKSAARREHLLRETTGKLRAEAEEKRGRVAEAARKAMGLLLE